MANIADEAATLRDALDTAFTQAGKGVSHLCTAVNTPGGDTFENLMALAEAHETRAHADLQMAAALRASAFSQILPTGGFGSSSAG